MLQYLRTLGSPIGLTWLGLAALAIFLCLRRKRQMAIIPAVAFVVITLIGNTPITSHWLASLERPYARQDWSQLPACDAVVMLGGTHRPSRMDVFGFDLAAVGDRVITAAELVRQGKAPVLVLSSGGYKEKGKLLPGSLLLERWLKAWGVPRATILHLGACNDTRDEAARTMALVREKRWKRVYLVTSANHMRRSEGVFRKAGVDVICVGCDFEGLAALDDEEQYSFSPRTECFGRLNQVVHEWIGWFYYKLRGWV